MNKYIPLLTIPLIAVVAAVALLLVNPDLTLRIRSQAYPPTEGPSTITKTFTWTPDASTTVGDRDITFTAQDTNNATTQETVTITVEGEDVGIDDVVITPEDTQATIQWTTRSQARNPKVLFDLNERLRKRKEKPDEPGQPAATQHEITLDNLVPCTTYTVRLAALLTSKEVQGNLRAFTTTGCTGNAAVQGTAKDDIPQTQQKTIALSTKAIITIPPAAFVPDGHLQIHQLDRDTALNQIGTPDDTLSPVTGLYEVTAYTDAQTKTSSFSEPVSVTLSYTPAQDTDTDTLTLWRHDGTSWAELNDCTVDTDNQTVTCSTDQFSAVAGFATGGSSGDEDPEPEPEPQPEQSSSSGGGGDSGGGDSGGGGEDTTPAQPQLPAARGFVYQVEKGWNVTGNYSGIQGNHVRLASNNDLLSNTITAPSEDYYFYVKAKHDSPGPVTAAVYVAPKGGSLKAWKVITLDKADDKFYPHQLGVLRASDFPGGTYQIGFRLLNDTYDTNNPANEATDRNLFVDWIILANRPALTNITVVDRSATGGSSSSTQTAGVSLLPNLNSYMRQAGIPVTVDNWKYYAWRLTRPQGNPAAITTDARLLSVMQYWKGARPNSPRGEILP